MFKQKQRSIRIPLLPAMYRFSRLVLVISVFVFSSLLLYTRVGTPEYVQAAIPTTLNFQARLLQANGAIVADGTYNVEFKLYDTAAAGASAQGVCVGGATDDCVWLETRTGVDKVTVKSGYLSVYLGDITAFGSLDWTQQYYLTMNIGGSGAPTWDGEMSPRLRLTSVPYAQATANSDQLDGIDSTGYAQLAPSAVQGISSANTALRINQTGAGDLLQLQTSGTDRFIIQNDGDIITALNCTANANGGALTANGSGQLVCSDDEGGGSNPTLQSAYDNGAAGDQVILLDAAQDSLIIRNPAVSGSDSTYSLTIDQLNNGAYGGVFINSLGTGFALRVDDSSGDTTSFVIDENGSVGIGDSSPAALLTVGNGDLFQINSSGAIAAASGITSSGTVTFSGLNNGFLEANGSGVLNIGTIDLGTDTTGNYTGDVSAGSGIDVSGTPGEGYTETVSLGNLSADWNQTGAFDIVLNNISSELRILGSAGSFYGSFDPGALTANRDYNFPNVSGTIITTGNLTDITTVGTVTAGTWQAGVIADAYINDAITISSSGSVDWTALSNYPAACGAGSAITGLGDTPTCTAFAAQSYVTLQNAYGNGNTITSTDARDLSFTLANTTTDSNFLINIATGATSKFAVQNNGSDVLTVTSSGANIVSGDLQVNGSAVITSGGVLQNVTANTSILTSGVLGIARGGTGGGSFTTNGVLYGNNTSALQVTAAGTGGQVLIANGSGIPTFVSFSGDLTVSSAGVTTIGADAVALSTDTQGNYVATITAGNGISGSSSTEGGTPTVALGALTANWNQTGAFDLVLNNASSELVILESAGATFNGTVDVGDLSANRTYTLPNGTGEICIVELGNCAGSGTGVTGSGTQNRISKFGVGGDNIADSSISDDGSNVTINGSVNLVVQGGSATLGTTLLQGNLVLHDGNGQTTTLESGNVSSDLTFTLPSADGSANQCLKTDGLGAWSFSNCNNGSGAGGAITLQDAYDAGNSVTLTNARDVSFLLADTASDPSFIINIATGSSGKFAVQDNGTDEITITSIGTTINTLTLTNDLTVTNGGTGAGTFTANGIIYGNGTGALGVTAAGTTGQCLIASTGAAPTWGSCASGGSINSLTLAGSTGTPQAIADGDTITIAAGINISTNAGATDTVTISTIANPSFSTSVTTPTLTSTAALGVTGGTTVTIASTGAGNDIIINGADILDVQDNTTFAGTVVLNGLTTANTDVDFTFAGTENLAVTTNLAGTVDAISMIATPSASAGTTRGLLLQQANSASTNGLDTGILINNADADLAITDAISLTSSGGGFTNILNTPTLDITGAGAITGATAITSSGAITFSGLSTAGIVTNTAGGMLGTVAAVSVANGGTGAATFTSNGILFGNGTSAIQATAAGTTGQCLVATTGSAPSWGSCNPGGGGATLQTAYDGGNTLTTTDARNITFTLANTTTDSDFIVSIATSSTSKFAVQDNGTDELAVTNAGVTVNTLTLTNALTVANGGTGATTTQGAINAISQLTTNGDLLFHNGTNSTRLARGSTNQCLLSTATSIQWGSCTAGGGGFTGLTLAGTSGTPQSIADTDTITIAAGTNITTTAAATDSVTIATVTNPTFSTSVTTPLITNAGALNIRTTGANTLTLGTDSTTRLTVDSTGVATFSNRVIAGNNTDWSYTVGGGTGSLGFSAWGRAATTTSVFGSSVSGDVGWRLLVDAGGGIEWGDGGASRDVRLSRGAANRLDLASGDSFNLAGATGDLMTNGTSRLTAAGLLQNVTYNGNSIADAYIDNSITVDWTGLQSYPTACSAGQAVTAVGDTLTCSTFATSDTNTTYSEGNDLDLSGTTFNIESQLDFVSIINQTSATLTLQTTTSGNVVLNAAGTIELQDNSNVTGTFSVSGNTTLNGDLIMGAGDQIDFTDEVGDKAYYYQNTYGRGIESSTLTDWTSIRYRIRLGGTSVSSGTEKLTLTSTGLKIGGGDATQALDVTGNAVIAGTVSAGDGTNWTYSLGAAGSLGYSAWGRSTDAISVFGSSVTGDTNWRYLINADGDITWGSGSTSGDVTLSRGAADRLDLASGDSFNLAGATGDLMTNGTSRLTSAGILQNVTYQGGTIGVSYGGTGVTTFTSNGILYGNSTGAIQVTAAGTTGQCLLANTGAAPTWGACGGGGGTLQTAYGSGNTIGTTDNRNIAFDLADTTTDSDFIVNLQGTGNIFAVQDGGNNFFTLSDIRTVTYDGNNGGQFNMQTDLSFNSRTTTLVNITQANNATFNNTASLLNVSNSDTGSTAAVVTINQSAAGAALLLTGSGTVNTAAGVALMLQSGTTGNVTLDSGSTGSVSVGTGANSKAVTVGSTSGTSSLTLDAGTGTIGIGTSASARTVNIATGAAAQTVTLGSNNTTSATTVTAGTGGLNLGNGGVSNTIQIGNTTGAVTQTIDIGDNATASSTSNINIGSTVAGATAIRGTTTITNRTSGSAASLIVSNSTSTGVIAEFRDNATAVMTIQDGGNVQLQNGGNLIATNVATATTGTAAAAAQTNTTTITLTAAGGFANNDVIFINNAGQDYFTRIVSGGGTTTLTVSPAVSYDASATITKYTTQNIGATTTDYTTLSNRFFQGYFLGGVVTGAGSTTLSDGNLFSTGNLALQGPGGSVMFGGATEANSIFYFNGTLGQLRINTIGSSPRLTIAADDNTNLWNIDNNGGTLRVFRENYTATGAGGGGVVRLSVTDGGVTTHLGPVNGSVTTPMFILDNEATSSQTVTEWRVAGTKRGSQRTDIGGNMVLSGTGSGATYLSWDGGTGGVIFGNGAGSAIGTYNDVSATETRLTFLGGGHVYGDSTAGIAAIRSADGAYQVAAQNAGVFVSHAAATGNTQNCAGGFGRIEFCTSSRTLKHDITDSNYGIDELRQLRAVQYAWNADGRRDAGFIAEEVAEIIPETTQWNADGTVKSFNTDPIISVVIASIQQLDVATQVMNGQLDAQQNAITSITDSISNLETDIAVLQDQVANGQFSTLNISGLSMLTDLTVTGSATIGTLTVIGDTAIQGKLTVTGDTEVADLYVNGKLISKGTVPQIAAGQALNGVLGTSTAVTGTDGAGTIEIVVGDNIPATGELTEITFDSAYTTPPRIVLSGNNAKSAKLGAYITRTSTGFKIVTDEPLEPNTTYSFDYIIVGAENP